MVWNLVIDGRIAAWVEVSDAMIAWLRPRFVDARVGALDPYRDTSFDTTLVEVWLAELRRIADDIRAEVRVRLSQQRGLPRDSTVRDGILDRLTQRELVAIPYWRAMQDAIGLLELSLEQRGTIHVRGD